MRPKSSERPLVYLACPYSHADPAVRKLRFDTANKATVDLIRQGINVFSPITHSHPLHALGLDGNWKFWEKIDREYLALSHKLIILTMPGWEESVGVQAERRIAWNEGMDVEYLDPVKGFVNINSTWETATSPAWETATYGSVELDYVGPAPEGIKYVEPTPPEEHAPLPIHLTYGAPPQDKPLHDSGTRKEFESGAVRDTAAGKGRYDLISPHSIFRLARVFEKGAAKYAARNWEKGMPLGRMLDSALRHTFQYLEGNREEDHLAQAAWNLMGALHVEEMIKRGVLPESLNDLPNHITPGANYLTRDEVPF